MEAQHEDKYWISELFCPLFTLYLIIYEFKYIVQQRPLTFKDMTLVFISYMQMELC